MISVRQRVYLSETNIGMRIMVKYANSCNYYWKVLCVFIYYTDSDVYEVWRKPGGVYEVT